MTYKQKTSRGKKLVALSVACTDSCWRRELEDVYKSLDKHSDRLEGRRTILTKALLHVERAIAAEKILTGAQ